MLIIADDQRWDTVRTTDTVMPLLANGLRGESVFFRNAVVSSPLCCPVRSSIITGGFAVQNHGVLNNQRPNGSATKLADARSLGTLLQDRGYLTLYIGKYMNGYRAITGLATDGSMVPSRHYI
ncbi:MAG: sulfatase-like hydrolase/transferase, partial [Acidobacteria bacterium]|nr:sulfatase-like hydrolase/transferase [Acidobacteriota bacterium]